jgi:hypothetical protein
MIHYLFISYNVHTQYCCGALNLATTQQQHSIHSSEILADLRFPEQNKALIESLGSTCN